MGGGLSRFADLGCAVIFALFLFVMAALLGYLLQ